jgi:hypothetical protein
MAILSLLAGDSLHHSTTVTLKSYLRTWSGWATMVGLLSTTGLVELQQA